MAVFAYKAVDVDASAASGTVVADTPRQARDVLRDRGLTITEVKPLPGATKARRLGRLRSRSGQAQVVAFVRDLATLLRAGIPLLSALHTLVSQNRGRFRAAIQQLADQVAAGSSLAEAMGRQADYFDDMCVSITGVGENTGSLESALSRLADFKEKAHGLRSRVTTALLYPAVVLTFGIAVTLFLMTYVVPGLLGTLLETGRELPAVTRVVKAVSDFLLNFWWALVVVLAGLFLAAQAILRTSAGRLAADKLLLRVPLVGELVRKENTSRMAVVLAALLHSGLQFVDAIRITRRTLRNRVFDRALADYEQAVTAGSDIAAPLQATQVFSPMVVQMLAVGQQSGQLEDMLEQLAEAYDRQVATATRRMTALLEPLLIVLLAVLVGFIAFAIVLPILEISHVM